MNEVGKQYKILGGIVANCMQKDFKHTTFENHFPHYNGFIGSVIVIKRKIMPCGCVMSESGLELDVNWLEPVSETIIPAISVSKQIPNPVKKKSGCGCPYPLLHGCGL